MLKKILYISLLLLLFSCEKIFINGNLDGMWRLESVDSGSSVVYPDGVFYSFQRHLVMLGIYSEKEHPRNWYMGCFTYENDEIKMNNFYRYPGSSGVCVLEELENLYIYDYTVDFKVEHMSENSLLLSSQEKTYKFSRW